MDNVVQTNSNNAECYTEVQDTAYLISSDMGSPSFCWVKNSRLERTKGHDGGRLDTLAVRFIYHFYDIDFSKSRRINFGEEYSKKEG